jgi:hypothetical protein
MTLKQGKTAEQLANMISLRVNLRGGGVTVDVHPDGALGWVASIAFAPVTGQRGAIQARIDREAEALRELYTLGTAKRGLLRL